MKIHKYILSFCIIIVAISACFSQEKTITFTDGSTLEVSNEQNYQNDENLSDRATIKIEYKEFTADNYSFGKAVPTLYGNAYYLLKKKNKSLAKKIRKVNSAYNLSQGETKFYFATFNSVNFENFRKCNDVAKCKVKCQAVIITIEDQGKSERILVIKSMELESIESK